MSNAQYNHLSRDVIVMKVTTKEPRKYGVRITNADLVSGSLAYTSFVQVDGIYAL